MAGNVNEWCNLENWDHAQGLQSESITCSCQNAGSDIQRSANGYKNGHKGPAFCPTKRRLNELRYWQMKVDVPQNQRKQQEKHAYNPD